jgi:uncharacterized protein YjiS (DUF1127 family)
MTKDATVWGAERTPGSGIFSIVLRAAEKVVRANARRRTEKAIAELDDHVLTDVGLNPNDVRDLHRSAMEMIADAPDGSAHLVFVGRNGVFSIPLHSH